VGDKGLQIAVSKKSYLVESLFYRAAQESEITENAK